MGIIMVVRTGLTNPVFRRQIAVLEKTYRETKKKIWKDLAERLMRSRRQRPSVNLIKINRYAREGEIVAVPGKVLGYGNVDKPLTIAALSYSKNALNKVKLVGGKIITFEDLVKMNKDGKNIRIME